MKKQYSILSLALSLFFFSVLTGNNVQAQNSKSDVSVSRTVSAGQTAADGRPMVVVTVTITKYAFKGPAKVVETFPSNYQAVLISSNHASFQAGNGQAQFTWSDIQTDRTVAVSYALEAVGSSSASQTVTGQLFYQNQTFTIAASPIAIDLSNLKPYQGSSSPANTSTLDDLFYSVTGNYPPGVTSPAPATASNNATAPSSSRTTPTANTTPSNQQQSTGNNAAQQQSVINNTPMVTSSTPMQQQPAATTTSTVTSMPVMQQQPAVTSTTPSQQQPASTSPAVTSTPVQQQPAVTSTPTVTSTPAMQQQPVTPVAATAVSGGSGDVVYHVQIIVVGDKSRLSGFFNKYGITDQKYYDPADGLPVRVMVGNYSDLNSAKSRCEQLRTKGITEAFIVPYYMGHRITIAEAATHTH